jgi:hypothetical protein
MPFRLTNAPSTFMRLMNKVLKDFIGNFFIVYLDDILIISKTKGEHLRHLTSVMEKFQQEKLLINLNKIYFIKKELIYLGFVISSNELKMDPEKVREIKEWPSPRNIFEVRSFHGFVIFYRKFIKNFTVICAPMLDTVKKKHKSFSWTEEDEKGFKVLKENIKKQPILVFPYFGKKFQVRCDASGLAIGEVLSQDNRLVSYFTEKMNDAKNNYSTYEK